MHIATPTFLSPFTHTYIHTYIPLCIQIQSYEATKQEMLSKMNALVIAHPDNEPLREAFRLASNDHRADVVLIGDGSGVQIKLNPELQSFRPDPVPAGLQVFDYVLSDTSKGRLLRNADKSGIPFIEFTDPTHSLLAGLDHYTNDEYSKRFPVPNFALEVIHACSETGHLMIPGQSSPSSRLVGDVTTLNTACVVRGATSGKPQNPRLLFLKLTPFPSDVRDTHGQDAHLVPGVRKLMDLWPNIIVTSQQFAIVNNHPKVKHSRG